jgi:hypothetical protein
VLFDIFFFRADNKAVGHCAVASRLYRVELRVWRDGVGKVQNDLLDFGAGELYLHVNSSLVDEAFSVSHKKFVVQIFFSCIIRVMLEKQVEAYLVKRVKELGGRAYKFTSPAHRGVADRIVCLPNGQTWFVEVKTEGGRLSELQKVFASDMALMNQKYVCLWNKEQINEWLTNFHA